MSPLAKVIGVAWLIGGIVYGGILTSRRQAELAI